MFGPVITTEAHIAFSGARNHSNNTAEMSAMLEALSFLGPHGPVARNANSCIYYHSKQAAGNWLGTMRAHTHVQLARACQQSILKVQHRLLLTTLHVYGHTGNLGNERADHAAALEALGLLSSHNLSTRWAHHSFGTTACFASCNNIGDVLEKLHDVRTEMTSTSQQQYRSERFCSSSGSNLARIALSCHFALDVLWNNECVNDSA